jgi:hypothetical protein
MKRNLGQIALILLALASCLLVSAQAPTLLPLKNPTFSEGLDARGVPVGWVKYAGTETCTLSLVDLPEGKALLLKDDDPSGEIGVTQTLPAKSGETYRATVKVRPLPGETVGGAHLQMRFLPTNAFDQASFSSDDPERFDEVSVTLTAPEGTTQVMLYVYTHRGPTPKVVVQSVKLESGVPAPPPPPPPPPPAVSPVYDRLKPLHLTYDLVAGGQARCVIVAPADRDHQAAAQALQAAFRQRTGVTVPIVADNAPEAALPPSRHLLVLGNRSTNRTSGALYDLHYSLVDLKYPGRGGHVLRSVHDPFGQGQSVVIVGGSDGAGVVAAAKLLAEKITKVAGPRDKLTLGWLMETRLGEGLVPPKDVREAEIWDASKGYGSTGYFGWNSLSKRMAMYYMLGDEHSAREMFRLAFPDKQALKEMDEIDGERIEDKDDPLAGSYHYNAHMMILYWDLIEESPLFTDAERLKVTNAFSRQLHYRVNVQREGVYELRGPASVVGTRHGQWSAMSLYCLARYFQKYYPDPLWAHAERAGQWHFHPLHKHAWVHGEFDNLFWYNTGTAPILSYMILTGDRKPLENGVLPLLLRGQEALISGRIPDWALNSAAMDFLNKAAYLTGDGVWITYRERTGVNTDTFRLGQSFWPEPTLQPRLPTELVGKWTINPMPHPQWVGRGNGFPLSQSFLFGSFRSAPDAAGDYILLDGYNGASRNPYHTFGLLELRLNGRTLLAGFGNHLLTSADGMLEPKVAMDAALRHHGVIGPTAVAVGEVPNLAYTNWRRTLAQRTGQYALILDDVTFRTASRNMRVDTTWQLTSGAWDAKQQAVRIQATGSTLTLPGWRKLRALDNKLTSQPAGPEHLITLDSVGIMLLRAKEAGQWLEMAFTLNAPLRGEAFADFVNFNDRGVVRVLLNGQPLGGEYDGYSEAVNEGRLPLGNVNLPAGEHRLRVEVVKAHPGAERCNIGFAGLSVRTEGAPVEGTASMFELRSSEPLPMTGSGLVTQTWSGPSQVGEHRKTFTLIAQTVAAQPLACLRLGDNAAALSLPAPALAVAGRRGGIEGELVVLAGDHLFGRALTVAGLDYPLVVADQPVELDWDFVSGRLAVSSPKGCTLTVRLAAPDKLLLAGKPLGLAPGVSAEIKLPAGDHLLTEARLPGELLAGLQQGLGQQLATGRTERDKALAQQAAVPPLQLAEMKPQVQASVGGKVSDLTTVTTANGTLLAVAVGKDITLLDTAGQKVATASTDGPVRVLHWWPTPKLLVAGCTDEKVIAFDLQGRRQWEFVSQMDPAVYKAAKTYWFKTAPGHEGIHGLHSGVFLEGKEQLFVGSACTLEMLDAKGQLVKRLPVFWGCGYRFQIIPGPEGSLNLLQARLPTHSHNLAVINNRDLKVNYGFDAFAPGHTYVSGWANMTRDHIFHVDLDGDGKKEIVSEIYGAWNRVTVWDEQGKALYNAQFGPGRPIPFRSLRDLDLADLSGDGKLEVITATWDGLLVVLNHQLEPVWSVQLPSPAMVLAAGQAPGAKAPSLLVGCEDGSVLRVDAGGQLSHRGRLPATPVKVEKINLPAGPAAVFATDKGEVVTFGF